MLPGPPGEHRDVVAGLTADLAKAKLEAKALKQKQKADAAEAKRLAQEGAKVVKEQEKKDAAEAKRLAQEEAKALKGKAKADATEAKRLAIEEAKKEKAAKKLEQVVGVASQAADQAARTPTKRKRVDEGGSPPPAQPDPPSANRQRFIPLRSPKGKKSSKKARAQVQKYKELASTAIRLTNQSRRCHGGIFLGSARSSFRANLTWPILLDRVWFS